MGGKYGEKWGPYYPFYSGSIFSASSRLQIPTATPILCEIEKRAGGRREKADGKGKESRGKTGKITWPRIWQRNVQRKITPYSPRPVIPGAYFLFSPFLFPA